jgi:hypothetical protein
MGTLVAAVADGDVRRWVLVLSLIDTGEAPVLLPALRRRAIPPATCIAFIAAELGSSGSGVGVLIQIIRDRPRSVPATKRAAR